MKEAVWGAKRGVRHAMGVNFRSAVSGLADAWRRLIARGMGWPDGMCSVGAGAGSSLPSLVLEWPSICPRSRLGSMTLRPLLACLWPLMKKLGMVK